MTTVPLLAALLAERNAGDWWARRAAESLPPPPPPCEPARPPVVPGGRIRAAAPTRAPQKAPERKPRPIKRPPKPTPTPAIKKESSATTGKAPAEPPARQQAVKKSPVGESLNVGSVAPTPPAVVWDAWRAVCHHVDRDQLADMADALGITRETVGRIA